LPRRQARRTRPGLTSPTWPDLVIRSCCLVGAEIFIKLWLILSTECLRDIGLEEEALAVATPSKNMEHTRWCHSMAGEEYARVYSWGHDPKFKVTEPPKITQQNLNSQLSTPSHDSLPLNTIPYLSY